MRGRAIDCEKVHQFRKKVHLGYTGYTLNDILTEEACVLLLIGKAKQSRVVEGNALLKPLSDTANVSNCSRGTLPYSPI